MESFECWNYFNFSSFLWWWLHILQEGQNCVSLVVNLWGNFLFSLTLLTQVMKWGLEIVKLCSSDVFICKSYDPTKDMQTSLHAKIAKIFRILLWTCVQLRELACSYVSLHAVTWACMQLYELALSFIDYLMPFKITSWVE